MRDASATYQKMCATARAKLHAPWSHQALHGLLAGLYIGLGAMSANLAEAGGFQLHETQMLLGGAVFPIGLIAILLTGTNLFTANCMYVVSPLFNGAVHPARALGFLMVSWLANFVGAVGVAYFLAHLGEYFDNEPAKAFVQHNAAVKCSFAFWVAFLRGVGANMLVCLGSWQALSTDDTLAKIFSMWWPAFTFTAISFEHCIANMFYVSIGLFEGAEPTWADFLFHNLVPVTMGNFVGGALFLGLVAYLTYDAASPLASMPSRSEAERAESVEPLTINTHA